MKSTIIYVLVFALAFAGTSSAIYVLNQKYVNIFGFDFREASLIQDAMAYQALMNGDELITVDSLFVEQSNTLGEEDLKVTKKVSDEPSAEEKQKLKKQNEKLERLGKEALAKKAASRKSWLKSTIKMYEAMQADKAAKLLASIPDKDARDILYSMKKKKAAGILSSLNKETVIRLTRAE